MMEADSHPLDSQLLALAHALLGDMDRANELLREAVREDAITLSMLWRVYWAILAPEKEAEIPSAAELEALRGLGYLE